MEYILLFLAVLLGYVVAKVIYRKEFAPMSILLAFSGAFLLATTLFELLPGVFESDVQNIGVYIMIGILLQIFLDFFSMGAEHGHVHIHSEKKSFPWLLFISLSIHAIIEGFPVTDNPAMLIGVIVHKVPIALILTLFFLRAGYSAFTTFIFIGCFALMTPLGKMLMDHLFILQQYGVQANAVAIGIFLHVSTTILFESSKNHTFNLSKMLAVLIAVVLAYFI